MVNGVSVGALKLDGKEEVVTVSKEELKQRQISDEIIGPVYRCVAAGVRPKREEWKELSWSGQLLRGRCPTPFYILEIMWLRGLGGSEGVFIRCSGSI